MSARKRPDELTKSEITIYRLIVEEGLDSRGIARKTGRTFEGVKTEVKQILAACGVRTRLELTVEHWKRQVNRG